LPKDRLKAFRAVRLDVESSQSINCISSLNHRAVIAWLFFDTALVIIALHGDQRPWSLSAGLRDHMSINQIFY